MTGNVDSITQFMSLPSKLTISIEIIVKERDASIYPSLFGWAAERLWSRKGQRRFERLSEFWELAYGMGESRTPRSGRPRHGMVHESSTLVAGRCSDCFECCNTTQKATAPRFRVG